MATDISRNEYEKSARFINRHKASAQMRVMAACIRGNIPGLIWGGPGEGKSAKINAYGSAWGYYVECLVGSIRERTDYLGLPMEKDGSTAYLPPAFAKKVNAAAKALLFLDEISTGDPSVQKANLRLVQERYAGDEKLGDEVRIIAAANPPDQAADGWDLPGPVANRFIHMDWDFDAEEWMDGMLDGFASQQVYSFEEMLNAGEHSDLARGRGLVNAFLRAFPQHLRPGMPTDEVEAGKAWASPRSWDNLATVLGHLKADDQAAMLLAVKGAVGDKISKDFFTWFVTADLHDPQAVLDDPSIVNWSQERPDRLFVLVSSIAALVVMKNEKSTWEKGARAFVACAEARKADVALPAVRGLLRNTPAGAKIPAALRDAYRDLFERTGQWQAAA